MTNSCRTIFHRAAPTASRIEIVRDLASNARKQQVRHVRAGNQKHEADCTAQRTEKEGRDGRRRGGRRCGKVRRADPASDFPALGPFVRRQSGFRSSAGATVGSGRRTTKDLELPIGSESGRGLIADRGCQIPATTGKPKSGAITPITVDGTPLTRICRPSTSRSPPYRRRQGSWPSRTTGSAPMRSSRSVKSSSGTGDAFTNRNADQVMNVPCICSAAALSSDRLTWKNQYRGQAFEGTACVVTPGGLEGRAPSLSIRSGRSKGSSRKQKAVDYCEDGASGRNRETIAS